MFARLSVSTPERTCMIDVTDRVRQVVEASGAQSGVCYICSPHTTAGVTINEGADPAVVEDLLTYLEKIVPRGAAYRHTEGNSNAHIKTALVGQSATVFVENGQLVLGTWQAIFLCEFDGPRSRELLIKVAAG